MDESLVCKCGSKKFELHAGFAKCGKCQVAIRYIIDKGQFIKEPPAVLGILDINSMNTLEPEVV